MNQVIGSFNSGSSTLSSIELLDLVNSARHEHRENAIRRNDFHARVADELEGENYESFVVQNSNGTTTTAYALNHDQCLLVSMRESKAVRRSILGKLKQIEAQAPALPDFSDPVAAARAWADELEQKRAAVKQLEAAKPAVEFVDRYVSADSGNKGFRQVAKLLQANERELRQFLADQKIMYKLGGEWMPYQDHIDAGRFVVRTGVAENEHAYNTAKFTPKGVNWVAGKWAVHNLQEAA